MKKLLPFLFSFLLLQTQAQITTPLIKANFGVDADLRSNYFNGAVQNGSDDWFSNSTTGSGQFIMDTTGAAEIVRRYATDAAFRRLPFFRTMRYAPYSVVNNSLLLDGIFIRDYHGDDSTSFQSQNKNGQSPATWATPVSSPVPDKNDIKDVLVHIRRAGPTTSDSLWLFGGVGIIGTTGNRFFDFEMYQTDIFYDRTTRSFVNYGPDAGHTSWQLDASGKIVKPGDVIFTAEFSSSDLSLLEARIWVHKSALNITPAAFSWGGAFDGANNGAEYGYANIKPKTAGAFYTGLQSSSNTWAGPFQFIDGANNVQTNYAARQFMEFSVNLTKLGLDPVTMLGGSACGLPFRRILAKSRSSTSFNAELKDFVGPFDFFKAPPVQATADVPEFCGDKGSSQLIVTNPVSTSLYTWTTPNGNILGSNTGTPVYADKDGMYIVTHQLQDGCSIYGRDTVYITRDSTCAVLDSRNIHVSGVLKNGRPFLRWNCKVNDRVRSYELQRSTNGMTFETVHQLYNTATHKIQETYEYADEASQHSEPYFYRIKVNEHNTFYYSSTVKLTPLVRDAVVVYPNPVRTSFRLLVMADRTGEVSVRVAGISGKVVFSKKYPVKPGQNNFEITDVAQWPAGVYFLCLEKNGNKVWKKIVVQSGANLP